MIKEMKKKFIYAIIDKAKDEFYTLAKAETLIKLKDKYPPAKYLIYDMTGNDDIPQKEFATCNDLTIDSNTKDWKWKLTDAQLLTRKKVSLLEILKARMVEAKGSKAIAESLGPDYVETLNKINLKITALQKEIDDLIG